VPFEALSSGWRVDALVDALVEALVGAVLVAGWLL
jgi:hypothetical protein